MPAVDALKQQKGVLCTADPGEEQVGAAEIQCCAQTTVRGLTSRGNHFL